MTAAACCASSANARVDAQHQRRRRDRSRVLARAARRPLDLRRLGVARDVGADDVGPVGDQAHLAETARGERRRDDAGEQRPDLRRLRARLADRRFLHRAAAASLSAMDASLAPRRAALKQPSLARRLLAWWDVHRRDLPWRAAPGETPDPYRVWLSEILLQQTTAAAAAPYYARFLERWPRVEALAAASLDEVIEAFAGLGYYARARNLHACAQEIARRGGRFPDSEAALRALPGVGAYTAAAVAAIAFGEPAAAVDGNVARIMARLAALPTPLAAGARGDRRRDRGARPRRPAGRLRPGADGPRRDGLPAAQSRLRRLSRSAPTARRRSPASPNPIPAAPPPRRGRSASAPPISPFRRDGAFLARRRPPRGLLGATLELPGPPWRTAEDGGASATPPFAARWRRVAGEVEQVFTHFALRLTVSCRQVARTCRRMRATLFWVAAADAAAPAFPASC